MRRRIVGGRVLGTLAVPCLAAGLLDPVEGGLPFLVGGALLAAAFVASGIRVPVPARVGWIVAAVAGAAALVGAVGTHQSAGAGAGAPGWVLALLIVYEAAVAVTTAGAIAYVVALFRAPRPGAARR